MKPHQLLLKAGACCLAISLCSPAPAATSDYFSAADSAKIDAVVATTLAEKQAPGAVLAIVKDGALVYRKAYGMAALQGGRPMTVQTQFEIGSLTKQMTAAAVLQLAAAGKLALSDRVGKYVPDYPAAAAVTVRQLLQQVSGIPDFAGTPGFAANGTSHPTDFAGLLATVRQLPLEFAPGERWKYSNTNYAILGHIVELASGTDFDTYLARNILKPAGMATATTLATANVAAGKAVGYTHERNVAVPAAVFDNSWIGAAGNLVAGVDDLVAWDRVLFIDAPQAPLAAMRAPATLNDGSSDGYGYGLFIDHQAGRERIWHGGGTLGFSSSNMIYPAEKLWIIALVNDGDVNATAMTAAIYDSLHNETHQPTPGEQSDITAKATLWLERIKRGELPATEVSPPLLATLTAHHHQAYKALQAKVDIYGRAEAMVYAGKVADAANATNAAVAYRYRLRYGAQWLQFDFSLLPDGRLASLAMTPD